MIPTTRNKTLVIILLALTLYGVCIASLKGGLPNQTATLVGVQSSDIQSLAVNKTQTATVVNVSLNCSAWNVSGEDVTACNSEEKLIISGTYTNATPPLFVAQQIGLHVNFSETPYLQVAISSNPDVTVNFDLGLPDSNSSIKNNLVENHPDAITEIDEKLGIIWITVSYLKHGENIDDQTRYITINVSKRLSELGLDNQFFVGLQIRQYLIGFNSIDNRYTTRIRFIHLLNERPYRIASTEGKSQTLSDGSIVCIIKKYGIASQIKDCPYLQRAYIVYTMDASQGLLYTIFLLSKHDGNLTTVRSGFVFIHTGHLNEIGTHIDWRRPIQLDSDFEPVATLYDVMEEGDYAIIFTPLKDGELQSIQLHKIEFTFSKLPYSSFVITNLNEGVLLIMSLFIVTIAGVLPTILLCVLFYMHKKNKLKDDKITIIGIVVIGLALRLVLAPISAYADDIQIFSEIGALYFGSGILGAQWVSLPGFVYVETAAYFPYALSRAFGFQDFQFLALAIYSGEALFTKLPSILSDLGSFYYILRIARKCSPREKTLVPALFLLSPLTIYISGILGQFDSIFTFAVIASIYYLVAEYKIVKATIFSSFAALLNPVGVAMFIPLLVNVSLKESRRTVVKTLLLATGIFSISMLPFFFEKNSPLLLASYERLRSGIPGDAFYGKQLNFYAYGTRILSSVGYGLTFRFLFELIGFEIGPIFYPYGTAIIFSIFVAFFIYKIRKTGMVDSNSMIYIGTFMLGVASLFQLTFPTIFDQFVVWIAGLLLVSYALRQNRALLLIFTFISIATGFIYVFAWRNYLLLVSGVETVPLGDPLLANIISASIGTIYSIILFLILVVLLKMWVQNAKLSKS